MRPPIIVMGDVEQHTFCNYHLRVSGCCLHQKELLDAKFVLEKYEHAITLMKTTFIITRCLQEDKLEFRLSLLFDSY